MKAVVQRIFRCEHCGKVYLKRANCLYHESRCSKNPLNKPACYLCENFKDSCFHNHTDEIEVRDDDGRYAGMRDGGNNTYFEPAECKKHGKIISYRMKCKLEHVNHGYLLRQKMVDMSEVELVGGKEYPKEWNWEDWKVMPEQCKDFKRGKKWMERKVF